MSGNIPFDPQKEAPLLSAYVDGELETADVARIEACLAADTPASEGARREIEKLRRLKAVTGAMRLKEPPPEEWEAFWKSVYNWAERSLGWIFLSLGIVVLGAWAVFELVTGILAANDLPLLVRGGILAAATGVMVLLVSVIRERIHKRNRTRYRNIIR